MSSGIYERKPLSEEHKRNNITGENNNGTNSTNNRRNSQHRNQCDR
jgi:hypothetical protein